MNRTCIRVTCNFDSDLNGEWKKSEVKKEMAELDPTGDWIVYVLEHVFEDQNFMTVELEKLIRDNLKYGKLHFDLQDGYVEIEVY